MDSDWNRIAKDFLFERSFRDNKNKQVTLLQSWRKLVAIIIHDTKTMIKTKKHYSYNVTTALDKLAKQQKLNLLTLSENDFYKLLVEKFNEDRIYKNWDNDIEYCEADDSYESDEDEDYEEYESEEVEESEYVSPWGDDDDN